MALSAAPHVHVVREPVANPYAGYEAEMETARLRRLRADLADDARANVSATQMNWSASAGWSGHHASRSQIIGFDSYEDYDRWKTTQRARGMTTTNSRSPRSVPPSTSADAHYLVIGGVACILHGYVPCHEGRGHPHRTDARQCRPSSRRPGGCGLRVRQGVARAKRSSASRSPSSATTRGWTSLPWRGAFSIDDALVRVDDRRPGRSDHPVRSGSRT